MRVLLSVELANDYDNNIKQQLQLAHSSKHQRAVWKNIVVQNSLAHSHKHPENINMKINFKIHKISTPGVHLQCYYCDGSQLLKIIEDSLLVF